MFRNFLSNGIELLKRRASPSLIFVMTAVTAGGRRALPRWAGLHPWKLNALEMGAKPHSAGWSGTGGSICEKDGEQPSLAELEQGLKVAPEGCCGGHS